MRKKNDSSKTGTPMIQAYVHPNANAQKVAKPFSGAWRTNSPAATAHPIRLSTANVIINRLRGRTDDGQSHVNRQNAVGTARSNSAKRKPDKSTASKMFCSQLMHDDNGR